MDRLLPAQSLAQLHGRYDLDQFRRIAAALGPDHGGLDAVHLDAVAHALAKGPALFLESLNLDRLASSCREGLLQQHVQGAGEGGEAEFLHELAALAFPIDEVLALT